MRRIYSIKIGLSLLMFFCAQILWAQKRGNAVKAFDSAIVLGNVSIGDTEEVAAPFLVGYYYATDHKNMDDFNDLVGELAVNKSMQYYGEKGSMPASLSLPRFPPNIHLAFLFRNWPVSDAHGGVKPFEYKLLDASVQGADTSTPWTSSGSAIIFPHLASGASYMLMVRYRGEGHKISVYFFHTRSWYYRYWQHAKKKLPYLVVFFTIVNILLLWRFLDAKRRNRQYQLELKSLFAQLNPHFLFNSLSSIQGLMNNNEIEKANQYLSGFSGLLRTTLDKGSKETIPLSEEMDNLENYIHFERLRFNFHFEKDIEPYLPLDEINMLPLLAQPLIENSVKHGISAMGENGILGIRIYTVERDLLIAVKDNGKGFDVEEYTPGYGVELVKKRIEAYNKWHRKAKIHLSMKSIPGNTVIVLRFENWLPK
ncbi:MAG: histidine kinase [Chitinophagaceae bacterium]